MDISNHIFSTDIIKNRIGIIFPDCVILDGQFRITAISQNILDATGYTRPEVLNHSINLFSNSLNLASGMGDLLKAGYFIDATFEIRRNDGKNIDYLVSGFYLGLVCDINGAIILKMNNQEDTSDVRNLQDLKTAEIDRFVYNAAHSLRGPLATMKGLINVAKAYRHTDDVRFLINQLDDYSEKLDDKLHKLIYFAESDKDQEVSTGEIRLSEVVTALAGSAAEGPNEQRVNFTCIAEDQSLAFEQGKVIVGLLRNLLHFFRQHVSSPANTIVLDVHAGLHSSELIVRTTGFIVTQLLKAKLATINNSYSEILTHPELVNYYAVKKIVYRLRGEIQFVISKDDEVTVLILIPTTTVSRA